jgi:hypothetical protein
MSIIIETGTLTVNAAFLQEIKSVDQELWDMLDQLRYVCSRPIDISDHCRRFVDMLIDLRDQLALHFALEEAYGYFEDPMEVAQAFSREAEKLHNEHRRLYQQFSQIVDRAEMLLEEGNRAQLASSIPGQFILFDAALLNHEERENEMLMTAMDEDLGGGD